MNFDKRSYTTEGCLRENKTRISNAIHCSLSYQDRRRNIGGEKKLKLVRSKTTGGKYMDLERMTDFLNVYVYI